MLHLTCQSLIYDIKQQFSSQESLAAVEERCHHTSAIISSYIKVDAWKL